MPLDDAGIEPASMMSKDELSRRRATLRLGNGFFGFMFSQGAHCAYEVFKDGLPGRVRVVNARMSDDCNQVILLLESESFDPVSDDGRYPEIVPMMREIRDVVG
jgi:hypothetical protein